MSKYIIVAVLSLGAAAAIAQSPSAEASASAPAKHAPAYTFKVRKPVAGTTNLDTSGVRRTVNPATNPAATVFKSGGA